jgi:metallo-beta-lactamase family protein
MKLTFFGAAREVTGSCYLLETDNTRFLVDCGLFQGGAEARARNSEPRGFTPADIDFVLLTHAHIDHSGWLPKLVADGFRGSIYATAPTVDLLAVLLPDAAHLQATEAERQKRYNNHHAPPAPALYTLDEVHACLQRLVSVDYDEDVQPHAAVRCRFRDAGHILGSAIIEIFVREGGAETKLVFTGDLGQPGRPILRNPATIESADVLVMESTYGNRCHKDLPATLDELVGAVNRTLHEKKGNVIIPAFAVGRTQELLYFFNQLSREGRFKDLDVYVDSPMATEVTRITARHFEVFDEEARSLALAHRREGAPVRLHFVGPVSESMALNDIRAGAVIISASGMCDGGRIRYHLQHNLGNPQNTVIITGFQAQGTLGRRLVDGAETVRIFGEEIRVRAEVYTLGGLSAHADQTALLDWLRGFKQPPRQIFVSHGEETAALALAQCIEADGHRHVSVPHAGEAISL